MWTLLESHGANTIGCIRMSFPNYPPSLKRISLSYRVGAAFLATGESVWLLHDSFKVLAGLSDAVGSWHWAPIDQTNHCGLGLGSFLAIRFVALSRDGGR